MKIRFIINPTSGTGRQRNIEKYISEHLEGYDIVYTQKAKDACRLSKEAVNDNIDIVIAVGGDGTVNECLQGLVNSKTALGVIPCGSGNGFAYHIGMRKKPEEAIIQLKNIRIEEVDTCRLNKIPFINVAGIGFDAHIANLFSKLKKRGFINYLILIYKELSYKSQKYTIEYNNIKKDVRAYMIAFANSSQYGNNAKISPMSNIKDGLINFVIVKDFPKWKIPHFLFKLFTGEIHLSSYVEIIKSKQIKIDVENTLVHLDGEPLKTKGPVNITLLHKSLKIIIPND